MMYVKVEELTAQNYPAQTKAVKWKQWSWEKYLAETDSSISEYLVEGSEGSTEMSNLEDYFVSDTD